MIAPPFIVNVPRLSTNTPPPGSAAFPVITPPSIVNAAFPPTRTPPPCSARPPVIAPDEGTLLVSVRSPPEAMEITVLLPLPVIVWPARSRRTAPETTRDVSPSPAAMSFGSVTVPPASSADCSLAQVIDTARHTSPFANST